MKKKLRKGKEKLVLGVCSGLAEYFSVDVAIVRIIFFTLGVFSQVPIAIIYIILAVSMGKSR